LTVAIERSVVINGDLGSGKSTVSTLLARRLGIRRISVGDLYREMAQQRGMTALELNLHAELDDKIDHYVDRLQLDIATSGETVVVDSRLAWFFFHDALKVHLITDPMVAADRVLGRPANTVESYLSVVEARQRLAERSESERVRFVERYGVDKTRVRNYDLVCDSTRATPEEIVATIVEVLLAPQGNLRLFIDPRRIHPIAGHGAGTGPIRVGYARPHFFVVDGHLAVGEAVRDGHALAEATLAGEADEPIDGRSAEAYFAALCGRSSRSPTPSAPSPTATPHSPPNGEPTGR
jgi:predicted cytidylate kinase